MTLVSEIILSGTRLLSTGYVKQKNVIDLIPENPHGAFPLPPPNITESPEMHGFYLSDFKGETVYWM